MKIAIFVEGLTEGIFVTALLREYFNPGTIQIASEKLFGKKARWVFFRSLRDTQQSGEHSCLIVDVSNDESVLSRLKENYEGMREEGYTAFLGLRDLKSAQYKKFGEQIIQSARDTVDRFKVQDDVFFHFAKMETEAWFLAEPRVFERINSTLTLEAIEHEIEMNLEEVDPQEEIANPATIVRRIHRLAGLHYRKRESEVRRLVSRLDWEELCISAREKARISLFFDFLDDLERVLTAPH
ncbi:MAG: DUF4276 family protein [Planctomycetota bacterium]|nr:DUF4276 family protein [Planctomycetota bacterium]